MQHYALLSFAAFVLMEGAIAGIVLGIFFFAVAVFAIAMIFGCCWLNEWCCFNTGHVSAGVQIKDKTDCNCF